MQLFKQQYPTKEEAPKIGKDYPCNVEDLAKSMKTTKVKEIRVKFRQAIDSGKMVDMEGWYYCVSHFVSTYGEDLQLSHSQYRRYGVLCTEVCQVNHSEVRNGQQDFMRLLESGWAAIYNTGGEN